MQKYATHGYIIILHSQLFIIILLIYFLMNLTKLQSRRCSTGKQKCMSFSALL